MFSAQTYIQRREKLKKEVGSGILLFLGNDESPMNYKDNTYHYRQDSSFLYFFGLNYTGLNAIIDIDENKEIIFGNELTIDDIVWMGFQPKIKDKAEKVGIALTKPSSQLNEYFQKIKNKNRKIHYLPPYRSENFLKILDLLDINPDKITDKASIEFIKAVVNQRIYKSDEEIAEIEKAVNVSAEMHKAAMKIVRPGMTEAQIAAKVYEIALASGGNIAFPIILTKHGETLHTPYHGNTILDGDLVLNDSGAETVMGYAGDMSRTFPASGKFSTKQKEIYNIAFNAHEAAIAALKPGVKFKDIHLLAAKTIAEGMKNMGFMKGDPDEAVAKGAHALFFQCGLGHMMGLDVHDMEDLGEVYVGYNGQPKSTQFGLKSLRLGRELQPGFVLTIEPGIYFIPQLIDMWKKENKFTEFINYNKVEEYKDFGGLRSEEDFVITETGYRLLGDPVPKTIKDIEDYMSE